MTPTAIRNHCLRSLISRPQSTQAIAADLGCDAISVAGALASYPAFQKFPANGDLMWAIAGRATRSSLNGSVTYATL